MLERALLDYIDRFDPHGSSDNQLVIAGGYARDRILGREPRDIDVFRLSSLEAEVWNISHEMTKANVPHVVEESHEYKTTSTYGRPHFDPPIKLRFMDKDVHITCTPSATIKEVIDTFDFNICRFWLEQNPVSPKFYSPIGDEDNSRDLLAKNMRLMHHDTPLSSLRRGFLFEHRFGFTFSKIDIDTLVSTLYGQLIA
jgi:hypothetical protein